MKKQKIWSTAPHHMAVGFSLTRTLPSVAAGFHSIQTAGHLVVIGALDDVFKQVETGGTPAWLEWKPAAKVALCGQDWNLVTCTRMPANGAVSLVFIDDVTADKVVGWIIGLHIKTFDQNSVEHAFHAEGKTESRQAQVQGGSEDSCSKSLAEHQQCVKKPCDVYETSSSHRL